MSKSYGEGFQQPTDFESGEPIPGSPRIGAPATNRPWRTGGNGLIILKDAPESTEPGNPSATNSSTSRY